MKLGGRGVGGDMQEYWWEMRGIDILLSLDTCRKFSKNI